MPEPFIVNAVARAVCALPGARQARIVDLSCGDGDLLEALARAGCRAEGTHFRTGDYIYRRPSPALAAATIHEGVDLCRPLPFDDGAFDIVTATEVLEHLPTHVTVVGEVGRVLRPDGWFVFTTPNIHRLSSRLLFLLTGMHELAGARLGWEVPREALYSTHFNPVYFPVMHTLLHHAGIRVERLGFTTVKPRRCLAGLLYPLVLAAAAVELRHARKRCAAGGRDLLRCLLDPRLLFSEQLMVIGRKREPAQGRRRRRRARSS